MTYFLLYTCFLLHAGIFRHHFHDFFSTFTSSFYLVVQTSTTTGYGDLMEVYPTQIRLLVIFMLITSVMFFAYFVVRFKSILNQFRISYLTIVMGAEEEMDEWLSVREKDAEKRERITHGPNNSRVIRKLLNTYRYYITHNFASVQEDPCFSKISWSYQQIITQNAFLSFVKTFSYLTKTIGIYSMKRLFANMTIRM